MNMHGDRLRLDHQPVATSDGGLSPLWAEAKTEHPSSCATKLQQGSFAPPELPGFRATMNPSDSRTWPKHGYLFPWSVVVATQPRHRAGSPRFLGGSVAIRRPLSPREVRPLCLLVVPRPVIGFTRFGGLATSKWFHEAETGSLSLRLTASSFEASDQRVAPWPARSTTWQTSNSHDWFLSTNETHQT